jgi:hypothetical protein
VYVYHWISVISQNFGDAALDEQNANLPKALLDQVCTRSHRSRGDGESYPRAAENGFHRSEQSPFF